MKMGVVGGVKRGRGDRVRRTDVSEREVDNGAEEINNKLLTKREN